MITTKKTDNWQKEMKELEKSEKLQEDYVKSDSWQGAWVIAFFDQMLNTTMDLNLVQMARAKGKPTISLLTAEEIDQYLEADTEVREMNLV